MLELPLRDGLFSMYIILPKAPDLNPLHKRIDLGALIRWRRLMKLHQLEAVLLPRFRIDYNAVDNSNMNEYAEVLREMRVNSLFHKEKADLSNAITTKFMEVAALDEIYHKSYISIDEYGVSMPSNSAERISLVKNLSNITATVQVNIDEDANRKYHYFTAIHPFIYLILDNKYDKIVLMGNVMNPSQ